MRGLGGIEDHRAWFLKYFVELRDHAPPHIVAFGGFEEGRPAGMASSLENVFWFARLVKKAEAVVLDAGAGASTWLLRRWFKNVVTTDPDVEYLGVVRDLCMKNGLSGDRFIPGLENVPLCDYTFYDYGNAGRMALLPLAWEKTRVLAYVDDTDTRDACREARDITLRFAAAHNLRARDYSRACDEYGRWGIVLERPRRR
jgi:hypothetical protein